MIKCQDCYLLTICRMTVNIDRTWQPPNEKACDWYEPIKECIKKEENAGFENRVKAIFAEEIKKVKIEETQKRIGEIPEIKLIYNGE